MRQAVAARPDILDLAVGGASVELAGITKVYGDFTAVDDVSLSIEPGMFVTLLGASGSGKTTLLRTIAGFVEPTEGELRIDGVPMNRVPVHRRGIGMVFQSYALFPHLNVYKNVEFPLVRAGVSRRDRRIRIDEALAAVRLTGFEHRMPRQLSGGQQQRVALARAIVARPRLLLMDEPLGALDRNLRESLQVEIRQLSRSLGVTVVNVTHDQEEALTMSDRIALLDTGRLVQFGTAEDLYLRPTSEIAAAFIGESNIFRGVVRADGSGTDVLDVPGGVVYARGKAERGAGATAIIRPGEVSALPAGTEIPTGQSLVHATVTDVIFAGESRRVMLTGRAGDELIARVPLGTPFDLRPGDEAVLTWDASQCRYLPAER
ncbi:ABC transporter ATP-binding protein [Microbacterium ulmi]|uniref:ABC transporter ATP-binding protein n=1 Tax=Microbacterium ulmi TaxID=179095 RepID=A0A7Y2M2B9_9MICO|nr:ABC transporter ATP-binding protein [Microbacterium ulmi]NII69876.1 putative spermidine/putrescine transport system ATP-binding protein [Microbacterium ulmi]NNH03798.1 ABC transporter ATP-binding protein [Microbacterium ulmi]